MDTLIKKYHTRYFHLVYLLQALNNVKGKVLDVGCGRGGITAAVKKTLPHLQIYACDNDEAALKALKKEYESLDLVVSIGDAQKLAYKTNFFDAVMMVDVLEHLSKPEKALREIYRVLKPSGTFHLIVPLEAELTTIDGWIKKLFGKNLKAKPIGHIQQFTERNMRDMLDKAGFQIKKVTFSYYLFYQMLSFIYYFFVAVFRRGNYVSLGGAPGAKRKDQWNVWNLFSKIGGSIVFLESWFFGKLRLKGQTMHVTCIKI